MRCRPDAADEADVVAGTTSDGAVSIPRRAAKKIKRPEREHDASTLIEAANFVIVAYSTFSQPSRPSQRIMSLPMKMPPMAGTFVACVVEEQPGNSIPRAAIIFKADVNFDCPQMPDFILRLIDSVDVIRRLSRRSNARVVASQFVLKNPLAELDQEKCQEIFYWQYLGLTHSSESKLM